MQAHVIGSDSIVQRDHRDDAGNKAAPTWAQPVQELLADGQITGFALVTVKGIGSPAAGDLQTTLTSQVGPVLSPAAEQFLAPFCRSGNDTRHFTLAGERLRVFHQTDSSLYALSSRRRTGVAAVHLPFGVLVVTWGRQTPPPVAVSHIERCGQQLRVL